MLLIWLVQWYNGFRWLTGGSSLMVLFSPQAWGAFARESTFSYTLPQKCKSVRYLYGIWFRVRARRAQAAALRTGRPRSQGRKPTLNPFCEKAGIRGDPRKRG